MTGGCQGWVVAIVGEWVPLERNVLAGMAAPLSITGRRPRPPMQLHEALDHWRREQVRVAIARVVDIDHGDGVDGIDGRDPGDPGESGEPEAAVAALAVNERGEITGSVPEGCIEEALVAEALQVLAQGHAKLVTFGRHDPSSRSTWAAGLAGGGSGTVHVFLEPLRPAD